MFRLETQPWAPAEIFARGRANHKRENKPHKENKLGSSHSEKGPLGRKIPTWRIVYFTGGGGGGSVYSCPQYYV